MDVNKFQQFKPRANLAFLDQKYKHKENYRHQSLSLC